jgi:succinate dehydrogenase / fumarate reductase, cytochrome b subunit
MKQGTDGGPVFFDLLHIQMPVGALTSITHRVTGVFLAIGVPLTVYLLDLSLQSAEGYGEVIAVFDRWYARCGLILLIWSLTHHLTAGTRHLLSDIDVGSLLPAARRSAWIVNLTGLAVATLAAGVLL